MNISSKSKINKQGCGLVRKRHGNGVVDPKFCSLCLSRPFEVVKKKQDKLKVLSKKMQVT